MGCNFKYMRQFILLGTFSAANIGITFFFQLYVLIKLGPGIQTDALFASLTIPQLVLTVISGSLVSVLVPLLSGGSVYSQRHDAWGFLYVVGGLFSLISVLLYLTASWWIPLTAPGFSVDGQILTIELTKIQLIGVVFSAINAVQWSAYNARQKFLWPEVALFLSNIVGFVLLTIALSKYGIVSAAWITTSRIGLQTILLLPGMGKPIWPNLKNSTISSGWRRIKPLLLGSIYYKTDPLVDRFLLSSSNAGSLSIYYFAQQIYSAVSQVLNKAIMNPMVPTLANFHKVRDVDNFQREYRKRLLHVGLITSLIVLVLFLFGRNILNLFVGYGSINSENINTLWIMLVCLSGVLVGGAMSQISASSFYATGNTSTLVRVSMISYTVFIVCKVGSFYVWGVFGLAILTSLYYITNLLIQIYILEKVS
jgi:putative peptidoglycan lipid II flippase